MKVLNPKYDWQRQKIKKCSKSLFCVKEKLLNPNDAVLQQQELEISTQLDSIVVFTPSIPDHQLPTINLHQPTKAAVKALLENQNLQPPQTSDQKETKKQEDDSCPKLIDRFNEHCIGTFGERVYSIAIITGSNAWVLTESMILLLNIQGKVLIDEKCCDGFAMAAMRNGNALFVSTSTDNVINTMTQTGKISEFTTIELEINDLEVLNDDVFAALDPCILQFDQFGQILQTTLFTDATLISLSNEQIGAISGDGKMTVFKARDFSVLYKDLDVIVDYPVGPRAVPMTADGNGRILKVGRNLGNKLDVIKMENSRTVRFKDYTVNMRGGLITSLATDDSGNLWIGTNIGEVIITKYLE